MLTVECAKNPVGCLMISTLWMRKQSHTKENTLDQTSTPGSVAETVFKPKLWRQNLPINQFSFFYQIRDP